MKPFTFTDFSNKCFLGTPCPYCQEILTIDNISRDHVVPKISKTIASEFNILQCCKKCNNKKHYHSLLYFTGMIDKDINLWSDKFVSNKRSEKLSKASGRKVLQRLYHSSGGYFASQYVFYREDGSQECAFSNFTKALKYAKSIAQVH